MPEPDEYDKLIASLDPANAAERLATLCRMKDALIAQAQNMLKALGGADLHTEGMGEYGEKETT